MLGNFQREKTMLRDDIKAAQVAAMKAKDSGRTAALRLILSKVKDRDIELRTEGGAKDDDTMVVEVLQKMVKQRRESISMYESGVWEKYWALAN